MFFLLLLLAVPDSRVVCVSRPSSPGSPTLALMACGWTQQDAIGAPDVSEPGGCRWAVTLPLDRPRRLTWTAAEQQDADCLTSRWGSYPRCPVKCPSERLPEGLIFMDGFESGNTGKWR